MKSPKKREYLNDYKKTASGEYIYTGRYYSVSGNYKKAYLLLGGLTLAAAAVVIGSGCINAAGLSNTFYVILSYIAEVSALFALGWNAVRLLSSGERVKEYVYLSAAPKVPVAALLLSLFSGVSLICSCVFILINGYEGKKGLCFLYLALKLACAALGLVINRLGKSTVWTQVK